MRSCALERDRVFLRRRDDFGTTHCDASEEPLVDPPSKINKPFPKVQREVMGVNDLGSTVPFSEPEKREIAN